MATSSTPPGTPRPIAITPTSAKTCTRRCTWAGIAAGQGPPRPTKLGFVARLFPHFRRRCSNVDGPSSSAPKSVKSEARQGPSPCSPVRGCDPAKQADAAPNQACSQPGGRTWLHPAFRTAPGRSSRPPRANGCVHGSVTTTDAQSPCPQRGWLTGFGTGNWGPAVCRHWSRTSQAGPVSPGGPFNTNYHPRLSIARRITSPMILASLRSLGWTAAHPASWWTRAKQKRFPGRLWSPFTGTDHGPVRQGPGGRRSVRHRRPGLSALSYLVKGRRRYPAEEQPSDDPSPNPSVDSPRPHRSLGRSRTPWALRTASGRPAAPAFCSSVALQRGCRLRSLAWRPGGPLR